MQTAVRVLIVDDAPSMRELYKRLLADHNDIVVVGAAKDAIEGRDMVMRLHPDVILLDLEMPRIDGITFLRQLMRYQPLPTLVISATTTGSDSKAMEALRAGAIDVIPKIQAADKLINFAPMLIEKILAASSTRPHYIAFSASAQQDLDALSTKPSRLVVAVGASTGGTSAVEYIVTHLNRNMSAVLVAMHLPERYTAQFAKRLDAILPITVKEAEQNEILSEGVVYIVPGAHHITLKKLRKSFIVNLESRREDDLFAPNIDYLFTSIANCVGEQALGIILTGMGDDGAQGLLKMREAGAMTIAEAESTAVVFGMPKAAQAAGAAWRVLPLQSMRSAIIDFCTLNQPIEEWNK